MRSRLAVARRELDSLGREKTIVLALAIQLFVAAFSSFLVVGLVALHNPDSTDGAVTIEVGVAGNASGDLAPVVATGESRQVELYDDRAAALGAFRNGSVDAVLVARGDPSGRTFVEAIAPEGDFRTTLVVVQLRDALAAFERERRADLASRLTRQPVPMPPESDGNPYYGFSYTVLVPLLAFLPVFISGSITADSLAEEIERGTLELLRVAPLSAGEIVDGKALATVALAPAQVALWLALLAINGTPVAHPVPILVLVTALTAVAVAMGATLALALQERRAAQMLYSLGILAAFALATLAPVNPANAVATFAIGSPTTGGYALVGASVVVAAAFYLLARTLADRVVG